MVTSLLVAEAVNGFGFCVSVTVTANFNTVPVFGAVNVGMIAVVSDNVTDGPAVWAHAYVNVWLSTCDEPDASSVTPSATCTVWSGPASAIGVAWSVTVIVTSLLVVWFVAKFGFSVSVTVTVNFNTVPAFGAVNVGCVAVLSDNVTAVPAVCCHR